MRQRVITGLVFTLLVAAFVIPSYWFSGIMIAFALVVGAVCTYELIKAMKAGGMRPCVPIIVMGDMIPLLILLVSYFM
ncbi:MAG: hypothetical protein II718_07370, partial [Clostridiales bacterium]|nr:hypothetical protein [Clostridiales bacterium]